MSEAPVAVLRWQNIPARSNDFAARQQVARMVAPGHHGPPTAVGLGESAHLVDALAKIKGYRADVNPEHHPLPFLVADGVDVAGRTHARAYDKTKVGPWGAGPSTMSAGWDHALLLEPPGVDPLTFCIGHLVPSVTRRAFTQTARLSRMKRRELHALEVAQIAALAAESDRFVVVADWNCQTSYEGLTPLWDAGLQPVRTVLPTHGTKRIDWFAVKGVEVVDRRRISRGPSDHYGIEVVVR